MQQQAAAAVEHQELAWQQAAVEAGRDQALQALYGTLVEEQPSGLEQAVAWALQDVLGFHLLYHREHTALNNSRGRGAMQAVSGHGFSASRRGSASTATFRQERSEALGGHERVALRVAERKTLWAEAPRAAPHTAWSGATRQGFGGAEPICIKLTRAKRGQGGVI